MCSRANEFKRLLTLRAFICKWSRATSFRANENRGGEIFHNVTDFFERSTHPPATFERGGERFSIIFYVSRITLREGDLLIFRSKIFAPRTGKFFMRTFCSELKITRHALYIFVWLLEGHPEKMNCQLSVYNLREKSHPGFIIT